MAYKSFLDVPGIVGDRAAEQRGAILTALQAIVDARVYLNDGNAYSREYTALNAMIAWPFMSGAQRATYIRTLKDYLDPDVLELLRKPPTAEA